MSELASASMSCVRDVRAVVGGRGVQLDRELDARAVMELVGVDAGREALRDPRLQDGPGLLAVERAFLAEHVDPGRVRRAGVEHRALDEVGVGVGVVLGRDDVGAEERALEAVGDSQRALLVGHGEPVAGLGLDGRRAGAQGLADQPVEVGLQRLVARGPGGLDRRLDPARGVRAALHARGELLRAVTREHEVAVGVDEARDQRAAFRVDPGRSGALGRFGPDPGDLAVLEQDRGVAQRPQLGVVGDERADVGDQHPTTVLMTSAAVAANTTDSSIVCWFGGLQARRGEVQRDQVGAEAGRDPAGVVPAQAGVVRGALEQGRAP